MTEPDAGSDLAGMTTTAVRDGSDWILNGSKTFISNGILADIVVVAAKTDPSAAARGISLFVVERGMAGFERGRNLDKIGLHAQDTAELFFSDVRVPAENLLGRQGGGFLHLVHNLPQERLVIALGALARTERVFAQTCEYARTRTAFGKPIGTFQHSRFTLAEIATELDVARAYLDRCVVEHDGGELSAADAAQGQVVVHRAGQPRRGSLSAAARRLRLSERVPGRACLARFPGGHALRRHDGNHEGDHRPRPRVLTE